MKKGLKIGLIVGGSLLIVGGVWAGLTKTGVIPNWFDIELFYLEEDEEIQKKEIIIDNGCYDNPDYDPNYQCDGSSPFDLDCVYKHTEEICVDKPMIYLYPTTEKQVNVKLGTPTNLLHTYPKYDSNKGWNVIAQPNGNLKDLDSGRELYALYREGKSETETNFDEGFVVAGKDIISFLEEKLEILGLNEREAEEFIVYWLPQMEGNEWNLIRFETIEEQNMNMPLIITPKPNTIIRVMMDWNAIDKPIEIPEQELITPERIGFTVVERGGSKRK